MKILHIINLFNGNACHNQIQDITLNSIFKAKKYAKNVEVINTAVVFDEDQFLIPDFIDNSELLQKSVLDINSNLTGKKLPLLADIIEIGSKNTDADFIIYTNIDIGLQLNFYESVSNFINNGFDAFAINRRRVSDKYKDLKDFNQIYAEAGEMHIGYDCFVFKQKLVGQLKLNNACIGIPYIDSVLLFNLIAYANDFKLYTNKHLTFHIGYDLVKQWGSKEFVKHNKNEYKKTLRIVEDSIKLKNVPGSGLSFFKRHFKWLMNPTMPYPLLFKLDLKGGKRYIQEQKLVGYYEWLQRKINLD